MALDPTQPWSWVPPEWNAPADPMQLAVPGAPVAEEVPQGVAPPPLSAEENAQIEIDAPPGSGVMTPPLLGEVDAVSGGQPAGVAELTNVVGVDKPTQAPPTIEELQQPSDAPLPSLREAEDQQDAGEIAKQMSGKSAEEQAEFLANIEQTRNNFAAQRAREESDKVVRQTEELGMIRDEAIKKTQARRAALEVEAKQIADTDPASTIPGYKKVLGVISAFIGGFAANNGGRNVGLDVIESLAQEAAQQQQTKLGLVQKQIAGTGDDAATADASYQRGQAALLATYDVAMKTIQHEVQQFDPKGTQAANLLRMYQEIGGRRAEAAAKQEQQIFKNELDAGELALKTRKQGLDEAKYLSDEQARAAKAMGAGAAKPVKFDDVPRSLDELRGMGVAIPANVKLPPDVAGLSLNQAQELAKAGKSGEDWSKAARENSPEERNRQFAVGDVYDVNGKKIHFRNPEKVAKAMAPADLSVQLLDRLLDAREQYGWSSDLLKSPEWRAMQSDFAQLLLEKKNIDELGVIAGPDMDLMSKALGTKDPTELRDPSSGLERIRRTTVDKMNTLIRAESGDQTPKRWEPPKRAPKAAKTPSDQAFQKAVEFDTGVLGSPDAIVDELGGEATPYLSGPAGAIAHQVGAVQRFQEQGNVLPSTKATIDRLVSVERDESKSKEERADAAAKLNKLATDAESEDVRAYAAGARFGAAGKKGEE